MTLRSPGLILQIAEGQSLSGRVQEAEDSQGNVRAELAGREINGGKTSETHR